MKTAWFDCFSGASGDMILGALVDAGLDPVRLQNELAGLGLDGFSVSAEKTSRKGLGGTRVVVWVDEKRHGRHHRTLKDVTEIISNSRLEPVVKEKSVRIFQRLAEAEARVHRTTVDNIHFHEVGAMDAIIDVVGAVAGLHLLQIESIYCSALHTGSGTVECAHGILPVPAPATLELVRGIPVYSSQTTGELLTPTGAAILTTLSGQFGPMPEIKPEAIGYGAGALDTEIPNLLRVVIGESREGIHGFEYDRTVVIETAIDDMNPQIYEYVFEKLLGMGARDVFLTSVHMKKNRPGVLVTVVCDLEHIGIISDFLLRETTTIGLRWRVDSRIKAERRIVEVETEYGMLRCKMARVGDDFVNAFPEYEDCKRIAREQGVSLKKVMDVARRAAICLLPDQ